MEEDPLAMADYQLIGDGFGGYHNYGSQANPNAQSQGSSGQATGPPQPPVPGSMMPGSLASATGQPSYHHMSGHGVHHPPPPSRYMPGGPGDPTKGLGHSQYGSPYGPSAGQAPPPQMPPGIRGQYPPGPASYPSMVDYPAPGHLGGHSSSGQGVPGYPSRVAPQFTDQRVPPSGLTAPRAPAPIHPMSSHQSYPGYGSSPAPGYGHPHVASSDPWSHHQAAAAAVAAQGSQHLPHQSRPPYSTYPGSSNIRSSGAQGFPGQGPEQYGSAMHGLPPSRPNFYPGTTGPGATSSSGSHSIPSEMSALSSSPYPPPPHASSASSFGPPPPSSRVQPQSGSSQRQQPSQPQPQAPPPNQASPYGPSPFGPSASGPASASATPSGPRFPQQYPASGYGQAAPFSDATGQSRLSPYGLQQPGVGPNSPGYRAPSFPGSVSQMSPRRPTPTPPAGSPMPPTSRTPDRVVSATTVSVTQSQSSNYPSPSASSQQQQQQQLNTSGANATSASVVSPSGPTSGGPPAPSNSLAQLEQMVVGGNTLPPSNKTAVSAPSSDFYSPLSGPSPSGPASSQGVYSHFPSPNSSSSHPMSQSSQQQQQQQQQQPNYYYQQQQQQSQSSVSWPGSQQGQPPSTGTASSVAGNSSVPYSPASQQGQNTPQSNTSLRSPQQPASSASNSSAKSPLNSQFSLYDSNQFNSPSSDSYGNKANDPNGSLLSTLPSMSKPPGSQGQASVYDQSSSSFGSPATGQQQQQPPTPQQAQPQQSNSESDQSTDTSVSKDERKDGESTFSQPDSRPQPSPSSNFYATMRSDSSSGQSDQSITGGLKKPGTPNSQSAQRPGSSSSMSHEGYMQRPPQGPYGHPSDPNQGYISTQMYPPPPPPQQSSGQAQSFGQMSHYPSGYGDSMNYDISSEMGSQMSSYGGQPDQRSMYDQSGYGHAPPGMDNMVGPDQGQMGDYPGEMSDMSSMQYQPSPYDEPFSSEPPTKKKGKGRPKKDPTEPKKEKKPRQPRTPKAPRGRGRGGRGAAMGDRMPPPQNEYGTPEGPYGIPPGHPDMYQMQGPPPGHPAHMGPMHGQQTPHDSFRPPAPGMMQSPGVHPGMGGPQGPPPPSMEPQAPGMGPPPMQQPGQPSMHLEVNPFDRLGQPPVPVPGQSMLPPSIPTMDATPQQQQPQPTAPTPVATSATSTEVPPDHSSVSDVMGRVAPSTDFHVEVTSAPPPEQPQQQQSISHLQPASTQQQQQQPPVQQQQPQPPPQQQAATLAVVTLPVESIVSHESASTVQSIGEEELTKSTAVTVESVSTIADETSQSMSSMSQEAPSIFMPPPLMTEESASHHQPDLSDLNSSLQPPSTMDDSSTVPLGGLEDSCKLVVNESLEQTSTPKRKSKKRKTKEEKEAQAAAAGSESTEKKPKKPKRQSGKKKKDAETPNESGVGGDMDTSLTNAADAPGAPGTTSANDQSLVTGDSSTVFDEATQEGDTTIATGDSSVAESPSKGGKGKGKGKSSAPKPKKPKLKDGKSPSKKKLPKIALAKFKGKRKKKLGSSNSDLDKTPPPSPDETESGIQKRRSGRVTKRTKYTDDIDLDLSDGEKGNKDDPDKGAEPAPVNAVPVDDTMVVEKIMCTRMGTRELEPENDEEEAKFNGKPPTVEVEEFYVKYKNLSYLHCDWRTEDELERGDKRIAQKIKRFKMKKDSNTSFDFLEDEPFNPDYCEVDRILDVNIVEELIPDDSVAPAVLPPPPPASSPSESKPSESTTDTTTTTINTTNDDTSTTTPTETTETSTTTPATTTASPSTPTTSATTTSNENTTSEPAPSAESSQEDNPPPASDGESATEKNNDDSKPQTDATITPTTASDTESNTETKDVQEAVVKSEPHETNESDDKPTESDSTDEKPSVPAETSSETPSDTTATTSEESSNKKPDASDTVKCETTAIDTRPKKVKISRHYLVKWQALPYEESTWELEDDLNPEKIAQFWKFRDPPPKEKLKFKKRPKASEWKKLDASPEYKGGHGLREYQLEGLNWLTFCWYNNRNCILADEMGLGKTIQSLTFVNEMVNYGIHSPFLIIAPLSTIGNWQREFDTWTDLNVITYHGSSASRNMIQEYEMYYKNEKGERMEGIYKFQVMITTFEIILTDCIELGEINWRACIIDEAHRLKNRNCKLLEGLRCLKIEHRVLLTGTPLQNNVAELFSLLNFLEPQQFASPEQFMLDFGDLKTEEQVEKLQAILKPMMLRRLKEDVEKSLAPKEETIVEVELTNIQKKYYRAILERNFQFLSKGGTYANMPNLMNTMMELRKCCIHPFLINSAEEQILAEYKQQNGEESQLKCMIQASGKLVLIDKLLPRLRADGHRVLIFSQMVRCLDILEDYVIQKKYPFERIDGRVRGNLRQAAIDRFSKPGSDRFVFLLCTRAGGLGINLTAADTVIIFDSDWNPQNDLQAQARCHRIGQQKHVKVYRLICRNTYEREMFDKASLKLGLDKAVLQSMNTSKTIGDGGAPLSKKEVEELLRKGAYGAVMDDDNAGDKFCEEDIDQILTRRTQVITIESGEKGSTFSKASFASSENADIEIDDPNFWEKWAKKANIDTEEMTGKNELIVQEPRRRTQTKRFGQDDGVMDISDVDSSDDDEDNVSGRTRGGRGRPLRARKGKKGRGGGYDRERDEDYMEEFGPGNWARAECFKTEMGLLTYGWGRWEEILASGNYRRRLTPEDIESIARVILLFSLQNYKGDEKIKLFIYDLITPVDPKNPTKNAGGRNSPTGRGGRKGRKSKKTVAEELSTSDWASSDQYNPELLLVDEQYRKHIVRHSNKLLLRVKMLYYLSAEVIGDLRDEVLRNVPVKDIPIPPPIADCDPPCPWWDEETDKSLLIGVFKHGYDKYNAIRSDPALCFYHKCGPPDGAALEAEIQNDDDLNRLDEDEEGDGPATPAPSKNAAAAPSTPAGDAASSKTTEASETTTATTTETTETPAEAVATTTTEGQEAAGEGENASSTAADAQDVGKLPFPSRTDMNQRLRRIIAAYQRHSKRQEIRMAQQARHQLRLEKLERFEAAIKERELKKREQAQRKWSRREEADFYRVVSSYGVEYDRITNVFDWNKFRQFSRLEKKHDETLTEYFKAFYAMCKRVTGRRLTDEEENLAISVDPISEERASRCLARIDLLSKIREEILALPDLDERLQLCQPSIDLPDWWICGKHDRDLLIGAAKYGLNRLDLNVMHDPDLSFKDIVKQAELDAKTSADSASKEEKAASSDDATPNEKTATGDGVNDAAATDSSKNEEKTPDESEQPVEKKTGEPTPESKDDEDAVEKPKAVETNGKEKDEDDKVKQVETEITKETCDEEKTAPANGSDVKEDENENNSQVKGEKENEDEKEEEAAVEPEIIKKSDETQNGSSESHPDEKPAVNGDAAPEELKTEKPISSPKAEEDESTAKPVANGEINGHDEEMKCKPSEETKTTAESDATPSTPVMKDETIADSSKENEESSKAETEVKSTENPALSAPVAPVKALRWPKDRVLQMRLEQIVYCIEKNEWPSVRHTFFSTLSGGPMGSTPSIATADSSPRAVSPGSISSVSREPTPHPTPDHTPRRDSMSPLQDYIFDNSADSMRRRKRRRRRVDTETDRTAKLRNLLHQGIDAPGHSYQQELHRAASAAQAAAASAAAAAAAAPPPPTKSKMPSAQSLLNHSAASFLPPNFFNSLPFMNLRSDIRNELLSDEKTASLLFSSLGLNPRQTSAAVANMQAAMASASAASTSSSKHGSGHSSSSSSGPPPAHQNSSSRRNAPIDTLDLRFKQSPNVLPAPPVPAHKVPKEQSSKASRQTSASPVSVLDLSGALAKPRSRGSLPSGLTAPPPAAHSSSTAGTSSGGSGRKPEKRIGSKLDAIALNLQAKKMMQEKTEPRETDFLAEISQKSEGRKKSDHQSGFGSLSNLQQSLTKGSKSSGSNPPAAHASASSAVSSAASKAIGDMFSKMPFDASSLIKGGDASAFLEKANLIKQNLTKFIQEHPDFFAQHPDLAATAAAAMSGLPVASTSSSLPANTELLELPESRRRGRRPKTDQGHGSDVSHSPSQSSSSASSFTPNAINFDENVPVVHRLTNKRLSGPKAPQLRNVVEWLQANPMYEIDPKWSQQLAAATRDKSSSFKVPASVPQAASQVTAHSSGMRTRTSDRTSKGELTPSPSSSSSLSSKGRTTAASLLAQAHQAQQASTPSSSSSSFSGLPAGLNPAALAGLSPNILSAFAPHMKMFMDNVASASSKPATSSAGSNSTSSASSSSSNNPLNPFFPFANLAGMTGLSNPLLGFPGFNLPGFPSPNSLGAFGEQQETTRKSKESSNKGQQNDSSSSRGGSSNEKCRSDRSSKSNSGGGGGGSSANLFGTGSGSLNSQLPFLYPGMNPNLFYPGLAGLSGFSGLPNANAAFASLQSGLMNGLGNLTGASGLPGSTSNASKSNKSAASNINASNATASSSSTSPSKSRSSGAPSGLSLSTASSLLSSTGIHPSSAAAAAAMGDSDDESLKSLMGHEDDEDDLNGDLDDLPERDDSDSDYDARPKKKSAPSKGKSSNTSSSKRANTGQSSAPSKAKS